VKTLFLPGRELDPQQDARRIIRAGLIVIAVGVLGIGGWAAFAQLSGAIIAPGYVKVDLNRKTLQHQEGGTVRHIRVRDGDRVTQGQELMVLEDVRVDAAFDLLRTQHDSERAKAARLQAEASFQGAPAYPADVLARAKDPKVQEILQRESALFKARRDALESQIAVLRKQIVETQEEANALNDQVKAEQRALELQREELRVNEELMKQNYVQKTRVITLQRAVAEYEARHGEHRAEVSKARQRASELDLRILSMRNQYRQVATDELKEASSRIFDLEERLRPSKDASERQRIVAPISGEVVGLRVFTPGAVVGPRDVLLEIVPEEKRLIVEARIRPEDINHVRTGSVADIRLTAYQQRTTPLVEGTVTYVSADRLTEQQTGLAYYLINIDVPADALSAAGNLRLQAGMPAEVFVRTDSRTTLDYLLAPFTAYVRRAFREPL
jgi:HlyD family type I secretion membrane fusion protein